LRLDYARGRRSVSPGAYGIRLSRHFAIPRRISIGTNVPIASTETASPTAPLQRNTVPPANRTAWNMSIVLNMDASSFSMRLVATSLVAARELAIERTAEPEAGADGRTIGGPLIIGGSLFTLGFLGFLGGFGCAHKTSGPMTWAFGRRPVCGTRLGETFSLSKPWALCLIIPEKEKAGGNPPA